MEINKTNTIYFGTKPLIGSENAYKALPKYNKNLTDGIYDAFEMLSKNNVDDKLNLCIGHKRGAKKLSTDAMYFTLSTNNEAGEKIIQSKATLSPKSLEELTPAQIRKKILKQYRKLTKSDKKDIEPSDFIKNHYKEATKAHQEKIEVLESKYGSDDSAFK